MISPSTPTTSQTESVNKKDGAEGGGFFSNKGAIAGVFTVVGLAALGMIGAVVYMCLRRRNRDDDDDDADEDAAFAAKVRALDDRDSSDDTVGHRRQMSLASEDYGTPIIDRKGYSTYVDQRLDVGQFDEKEEIRSLNDGEDYSRRVLQVMNP